MTASTSKCKSCHAPILWAETVNGRRIPLDAHPDPTGNVELHADGRAVVHRTAPLTGVPLYRAHHQTCPYAAEHRRSTPIRRKPT